MQKKLFTITFSILGFSSLALATINAKPNLALNSNYGITHAASYLWNIYNTACSNGSKNSFCNTVVTEQSYYLKISSACKKAVSTYTTPVSFISKKGHALVLTRRQFILFDRQNKLQPALLKQLQNRRNVLAQNLSEDMPLRQNILSYLDGITNDVKTARYTSCAAKIDQVLGVSKSQGGVK